MNEALPPTLCPDFPKYIHAYKPLWKLSKKPTSLAFLNLIINVNYTSPLCLPPYKQAAVCYVYISACGHVVCTAGLEKTKIGDIMACVINFKLIGNRLWLSFSNMLVVLRVISGSSGECLSGDSPVHLLSLFNIHE